MIDSRRAASAAAVAVATAALASALPARAQTPADLVVVPFTFPGDKAPYEDAAVEALVARFKAAGANVTVAKAIDPFTLTSAAPGLCSAAGAHAIVTGRLRVEQTATGGSLEYVPYVGPLAKALVNPHPSHAVATLDRLDCSGRVLARAEGTGDIVHHGQNVAAGVTVSVQTAIANASAKLITEPDGPLEDDVWLVTGAQPAPVAVSSFPQARENAAGPPGSVAPSPALVPAAAARAYDPKRIALTALEDTIDPDPREQFADSTLLKRLGALGYATAEIAPLDRYDVARLAPQICTTAGAGRILASAVRYEQSAIDTLFSTSYPTHAFLHFDLLDCNAGVVHSEDVSSDVRYGYSNVGAAISKAIDQGVATGLVKLGLTGEATAAR